MGEKVTTMILKADLECHNSYRKVKKILCKIPEIRDQMFDEKNNLVTITVVCSSPEKIRHKLYCKRDKVIRSIEIVVPPPPKPKEPEKQPKQSPPRKTPQKSDEQQPRHGPPQTVPPYPPPPAYPAPVWYCGVPCSEGYGGGPCYCGYGKPVPPPPCYDHYGYWYGSRCDYFSDENAAACTIL